MYGNWEAGKKWRNTKTQTQHIRPNVYHKPNIHNRISPYMFYQYNKLQHEHERKQNEWNIKKMYLNKNVQTNMIKPNEKDQWNGDKLSITQIKFMYQHCETLSNYFTSIVDSYNHKWERTTTHLAAMMPLIPVHVFTYERRIKKERRNK